MTTATNTTLDINTVATGGAVLIDWELYGTKCTPNALRAALVAHGFDPSVVPDIDQNREVRKIAHSWKQGRGTERYSSRVLFDDADELTISVRVDTKAGARIDQLQFATVMWDKTTLSWGPTTYGAIDPTPHVSAVADMKDKCDIARLNHDHEFIRPVLIVGPLKTLGAVPFIRRSGGAQVVPAQSLPELRRLQGFVNSIGDSYMGIVKCDITDAGTRTAVERSVRSTLTEEIANIRNELQDWRDRGQRLPTGSIGTRLNKFAEIRDKARLFADSLGMVVTDFLTEISDAEADARLLLNVAMGVSPPSTLSAFNGVDTGTQASV